MDKITKEFVHGYHLAMKKDNNGKLIRPDVLVVKENWHYPDGRIIPKLTNYKNYKRPFYITKEIYKNHKQNKQYEEIDKLHKYYSTDSELPREILRKLGVNKFGKIQYRDAIKSPYVYGSDVSALVLLKEEMAKTCTRKTPLTVTFYDIENDVDTKEISIVSSSRRYRNKIDVFVVINVGVLKTPIPNIANEVKKALLENLPDNLPKSFNPDDLVFDFVIVDNDGDLCLKFWEQMHKDGSDILASWSTHDIRMFIERMKHHNIDYKRVLSDPGLPPEYHDEYIKIDKTEKITQSGKRTIVFPEKQWHLFRFPAKFYILDNMSTYYFNRRGSKEVVGGYSLQNILSTDLGFGKLKFPDITDLTDTQWHIHMLKNEPVKYFAYNIWDQLGMLCLEDETTDISIKLPSLVERSLYEDYAFSMKAILDDFHFYALENNVVLGTQVIGEEFPGSLGRDDWTVTLMPYRRIPTTSENTVFKNGVLDTNLMFGVGDNDVTAAYPMGTIMSGLSKMSTVREVTAIEGKSVTEIKRWNGQLLTGKIAHTGYLRNMFNAPDYKDFTVK